MSINLSALMKQRYDTAANWTAQNPTLLAGEIGIESDTKKWKVGTGSTAWTSLVYAIGGTYPIVNADIAAGAAIVDTKLATITTAGKVSNSATTAASTNTASAIVARDASGNFTASTITAALTGAASDNVLKAGDTMTGVLAVTAGTAALPGIAVSGDLNTGIYSPGADQLALATAGTGRLFINAAGLVDISNTTSDKLTLSYPGFGIGTFGVDSTGSLLFKADEANTQASSIIQFKIDGGEKLRIDSSGNVGIGVTPSTFSVGKALEIGFAGNTLFGATSGQLNLMQNATYNAAFKYASTAAASYYQQLSGAHIWYTAPSGTAGAAISFAQAMTLDASGRLLVGTSIARANIYNAAYAPIFQVESTGTLTQRTASFTYNNGGTTGGGPVIQLITSRSSTAGGVTLVGTDDELGSVQYFGTNGTAPVAAAAITTFSDGAPSSTSMPGRLVFSTTASGSASPTERLRITNDGVRCYNQPTPATYAAAATLTVADLKTAIITYTGAAATLTLPTGTLTEGGFAGIYTNMTFEWSVINTGSGLCTVGAGTGHTITGGATIAAGDSGRFASRRTAANTFVSYRIS